MTKRPFGQKSRSPLRGRDRDNPRVLNLETEQVGTICLGTQVEDVDAVVPHARVEVGPGPEAVLIAPINIQCNDLFDLRREGNY